MRFLISAFFLCEVLAAFPTVPPGFTIRKWAEVPSVRSLAVSTAGAVFAGTRDGGRVYRIEDTNQDGVAETVEVLLQNRFMPNGVAILGEDLYVAEVDKILKLPGIVSGNSLKVKPVVVYEDLPDDTHHGWKFIRFDETGRLYVPVGAPCNICDPKPPYAAIHQLDLKTGKMRPVALGVRNTVGFDFNPEDRSLWFTDNGRDWMGDDLPPEELNRLSVEGEHFGYPYCHAGVISDPEFGHLAPCSQSTMPRTTFLAHTAALGVRFVRDRNWPEKYRKGAFVAQHGSWNRSRKQGYQVSFVAIEGSRVVRQEVFASGWLQDERVSGRPVDVDFLPDGRLLISDDYAGVIWQVQPEKPRPTPEKPRTH